MIGVMQHDMSVGVAGETYTLLTIGDGLVAQIPGLVISTAAGVVVTRVANDRMWASRWWASCLPLRA